MKQNKEYLRFRLQSKGFTFVELLLVIAIIAILATIGYVIFIKVLQAARDAKRKGDLDAISKAYEIGYTSRYNAISDPAFSSGGIPKDPNPSKGSYFNWLPSDGSGFKVCASLESNPNNACNTPATNCYCKTSNLSTINSSVGADSSSTQVSIGLGGSSAAPSCDPNGVMNSGLVGYWKFNEGNNGSSVADSSGHNYNGTWVGSGPTRWSSAVFSPQSQFTGNFNGTNDYVKLPVIPKSSSLTVTGWFRFTQPLNPSDDHIGWGVITNANNTFGKLVLSPSRGDANSRPLRWFFWETSGRQNSASGASANITINNWYFFAMVYNKATQSAALFLNGEEVAGMSYVVDMESGSNSYIAIGGDQYSIWYPTDSYAAWPLPGQIDEVRFYNKPLSEEEIVQMYNEGAGCFQ